jgi:hypothetical protein
MIEGGCLCGAVRYRAEGELWMTRQCSRRVSLYLHPSATSGTGLPRHCRSSKTYPRGGEGGGSARCPTMPTTRHANLIQKYKRAIGTSVS